MKKVLALVLAVVMMLSLVACGGNEPAESGGKETGVSEALLAAPAIAKDFDIKADFKFGVICLHDENSTYDNNFLNGVKAAKEALGLTDEQVLIKTNVPESTACYDAAIELADKGCNIIFADSFGHEAFMAQAAKERPEIQFCHATGTGSKYAYKDVANMHNAFASIYEGRYLAGIAAGLKLNEMIAAGKITAEQAVIGYVGAFTYAEVISGMTSFFLGARSVCPSATMKVRYTGSWYDQALEQEAATALIEQDKCALISQHADSLGAPTACELAGVPNVSYNGSTYSAGENTFIISSAINWAPYFAYIIKCVNTGVEIDKDWCGSIATGSIVLSGINKGVMAEGSIEAINAAIEQFKAGTLHVFATDKYTVEGKVDAGVADVDGDYTPETNVVHDGYFDESNAGEFRSAPYFDRIIDGVTNLNTNFG